MNKKDEKKSINKSSDKEKIIESKIIVKKVKKEKKISHLELHLFKLHLIILSLLLPMIAEMLLPGHLRVLKDLKVQENQHLMLRKLLPIQPLQRHKNMD